MKKVLKIAGITGLVPIALALAVFLILNLIKGCCWVQDWTAYYDEDMACHHEECVNKQAVYTVMVREMVGYKYPTNASYLCYELRNLDGENCVNVGGVNFYKGIVARLFPSGELIYFNPDDVVSVTKNSRYVKCHEKHEHFGQWIVK